MRMHNILLVILCVFLSVPHVLAAENPYESPYRDLNAVSACDGGPTNGEETCVIDGDLPNPTINTGNTTKPCKMEIEKNKDTGQIIGEYLACVASQTHTLDQWFEWGEKPAATYNIQPLTDMLEGARLPLTPLSIWNMTTRNITQQKDWYWARRCDYKKQNDGPREEVRNELSDEKMTMGPYTNLSTALEDAEAYQTFWTWASKSDQNYLKAIEMISSNVYPCLYSKEATETKPRVAETQGRGIWDLIKVIFATILEALEAKNSTYSYYTETSRKPHSENMSGVLVSADDKVFENSRVSETRKKAIKANPGIVDTFRPCGLKFEPDDYNGEILNEYQWGDAGDQFEQYSRQHQTNLWDAATNYMKSTLLPAQFQTAEQKKPLDTRPCGQPTPTPEEGGWNCTTGISEQLSESVNQAGKNWADNNIYAQGSCPTTENAWEQCHNDVVARAKKACVDPLFALTIWLHESAASNYKCGSQLNNGLKTQDFGVNIDSIAENFSAQIDRFLGLNYDCPQTMQDWVSMYYIGNHCFADEPDKTKVTDYVAELQEIYTALGGGTLPTWPKGACSNTNI